MTPKLSRPNTLPGNTTLMKTGCGNMYVTINNLDDKPFEIFMTMGKAGTCASAQCESIGRLVSYSLRTGGDIAEIIKELKGISCQQPTEDVKSCSDAVAQVLQRLQEIGSVEA
jgi:ribonucleoside-diphosphate reductase alpha chain